MASIKNFILLIKKYFLLLLNWIFNIVIDFLYLLIEKYSQNDFESIYGVYSIINIVLFITLTYNRSYASDIIKVVHIVIQTLILILILVKVVSSKKEITYISYLNKMAEWSCAALVVAVFNLIYLMQISELLKILFIYTGDAMFFLMVYYRYRIFVYKKINSWKWYTVYLFLLPFISLAIWTLAGMLLSELIKSNIFVSSNPVKYMTIIITVLIFNIEIYFTPKEKIDEVRVAVYLILAIFSTISYCFFISDYIAQFIYNIFIPYKSEIINEGINLSKESIKSAIDNVTKWVSLPYLVGSVWGCFTLELVSRNMNIKTKNNNNIAEVEKP